MKRRDIRTVRRTAQAADWPGFEDTEPDDPTDDEEHDGWGPIRERDAPLIRDVDSRTGCRTPGFVRLI